MLTFAAYAMWFTCFCKHAVVVPVTNGGAAAGASGAATTGTGTGTASASGVTAAGVAVEVIGSCGGTTADTVAVASRNGGGSVIAGAPRVAPPPVSLLVPLLAGNPLAGATVLACLTTADVNSLRRLHPALPALVAGVPWADTAAAVVNVVRWRKVLPVAAGARFTRRAVGDPARAAAALAGVTHLDLHGGDYVRAKLLYRSLPTSLRALNVSACRNLDGSDSFAHCSALEVLNCSRTTVVRFWAGGLPSSLRELDISYTMVMWNHVSLAHLRALRVLRATGSALGDATLASLRPSLEELHAVRCLLRAASFAHLPALRVLDVSECPIGDASLASLPPWLVHLGIRKCERLTPAAVLPRLPALTTLDGDGSTIGDVLVASLPAGLVELRLTGCYNVTRAATLDHLPALRLLHSMDTRLDGAVLAACRARGCVAPAAMQLVYKSPMRSHAYHCPPLAVLADGRLAYGELPVDGGYRPSEVHLWELARAGEGAAAVVQAEGEVKALAALPDGRLAVGTDRGLWDEARSCSAGSGVFIEVWDVRATPPVRCSTIACGTGCIHALVVLRDGRLAARCDDSKNRHQYNVWIVDVDAGTASAVLKGHTGERGALAALPDGRLASGTWDKEVQVWDVGARKCVATLEGQTREIRRMAVLADGRLASYAMDGTLQLWDVGTSTCVGMLAAGIASGVMAALPDGRLAIGSESGAIVQLWDTHPTVPAAIMPVLDLRQSVRHIQYVTSLHRLQDGRLACVCRYCENPKWNPNREFATMRVYLLDVPPLTGTC